MMVILKGAALKRIEISLLKTGRHPKTALNILMHKKSNTMLMSELFSTEINLVSIICWHLTIVFPAHLAGPNMFQWYLLIAWVSSSSFPADLRVLTSHVPTEMLSLPLIFFIFDLFIFDTSVAHLSPTSRCLTVGAVIVLPGCDQSGIKAFLMLFIMVYIGRSSAWRSPSLSRLSILTTAEIHDYCMARPGHEHMVVDSKSFSALAVSF